MGGSCGRGMPFYAERAPWAIAAATPLSPGRDARRAPRASLAVRPGPPHLLRAPERQRVDPVLDGGVGRVRHQRPAVALVVAARVDERGVRLEDQLAVPALLRDPDGLVDEQRA